MVKIRNVNSGSPNNTPKGKKLPKNQALTNLQSTKNPENRRKSLGAVLPTPKTEKKSRDFKKRQSFAAFPVPQFEETSEKQSVQNGVVITDNIGATPNKLKRRQSSVGLNALQIPHGPQNGGQINPTPKSNKNKKTSNDTLILTPNPKSPKRKQSILLNNDIPLLENGLNQEQISSKKKRQSPKQAPHHTPLVLLGNTVKEQISSKKKKQTPKHTPLVLAPKNNSPEVAMLENRVKEEQTPSKKRRQPPKHTPLVLAPKNDSPEVGLLENGVQKEQTPSKKNRQPPKYTPLILAPKNVSLGVKMEPKVKLEVLNKQKNANLKKQPKQEVDSDTLILDIPELEKKHNVLVSDVKIAIEGVVKFAKNNPKLQNQLFTDEIPLFLQINSFKIPKKKGAVKHVFRVPLEHSILTEESDICLIVPDVKGIPNKELEQQHEHYEKLLADKGVKNIKKIMTFYEFRTEYETFELKNRLADLYDIFLVDGRISGKVVHKAGQVFYKKRKLPNSVKLHVSKLADHIDKALKKAYFDMNCKSDSCMVQFGHSKMTTKELIDNVYSLVQYLDRKFPGKMENIRSLNVFTHRGSSIPIYLSLKNPNDIKVPTLKHQKPKAYKSYLGELTTQYNADVLVRPSGKVIVRRSKIISEEQNEENGDNVITEKDILAENKQAKEAKKKDNAQGKKRKVDENNVEVKLENIKIEGDNKKIKKENSFVRVKKENSFVRVKKENFKQENNNKRGKNNNKGVVKKVNGYNKTGNKNNKNKGKKFPK